MRAVPGLDSLREPPAFDAVVTAIAGASRPDFRVVHYSVQSDHVHIVCETHDRLAHMRGMRGLAIRSARAINQALNRHGRVWGDRYHSRPLTSPREVRAGLVYVLQNWRKRERGVSLDPCSSAKWFDGWQGPRPRWAVAPPEERSPLRIPRTWLLSAGWRRLGLIDVTERPKGSLG